MLLLFAVIKGVAALSDPTIAHKVVWGATGMSRAAESIKDDIVLCPCALVSLRITTLLGLSAWCDCLKIIGSAG